MKIKFVYGIFPALVLNIPWLKEWGFSLAFIVLMPTKLSEKEYDRLLKHELTHVKQFYRTFGLSEILYLVSRNYRWHAEIEAYATGVSVLDENIMLAQIKHKTKTITEHYRTNKTLSQTRAALLQEVIRTNNFKIQGAKYI